ncbi:MAG TPA: NUDIX hydrolase [Mycobacteriales bacterium]|nr:NUDIX hydrolase [Mycobacteriales bacterium]
MAIRVLGVAAVLAVVAMYCVYTARRLDGLHARIDAAAAALDAQLRLRCEAVVALAGELHGASGDRLRQLAAAAAAVNGLAHDREVVENALSVALTRLSVEKPAVFLAPSAAALEVHDDAMRAAIARRFYNDTVRDALVVRDRRTVRWLALAGHAAHPSYFEMHDDELPTPAISVATQA